MRAGVFMKPRPWLILPIESNVRELHARVLLASVAVEKSGFGVVIGRVADLAQSLPNLPPGVILQKDAHSTPYVIDLARKHGHVVTALDEEGLVYRSREIYLRQRISVPALEGHKRFFAWGEAHRADVLSKVPHLEERVVAIGNPRIDLLRPGIREIYATEAKNISDRYGRFVLVQTSLGHYNNKLGADEVVRHWKAKGRGEPGDIDLLERLQAFERRLFDEFSSLIEDLAGTLSPDDAIVLRPHPSERQESWKTRLGHLRGVRVVHEGNVIPWLIAAEALVHNSSTSGIEAVLLGRPTFAFLPVRDERVEGALANNVSRAVTDRRELVSSIVDVLRGQDKESGASSIHTLANHIANLEGRLASEALADELQIVAPPPAPLSNPRARSVSIRFARAIFRARSFASGVRRRDLRGERDLWRVYRSASPAIAVSEIADVLAAISTATGRFSDVSCAALAPDLVVIG